MKNQGLEVGNDKNAMDMENGLSTVQVRLDKSISAFLERQGYENYSLDKFETESPQELGFIKILNITYDRKKDETDINLIDFEQILSAVSSKTSKFAYIIDGDKNGVSLYIGTAKDSVDFLNDTFNGIYSGSQTQICENFLLDDIKNTKAMLGIPSLKRDSEKNYKQNLEKIIFPMEGKKFRIILVADSYSNEVIRDIISSYQNLGDDVHKITKISKSANHSLAHTEGFTFTIGSSQAKGVNLTENKSHTKGYNDKGPAAKAVGVATTVLAGVMTFGGALVGAGIGAAMVTSAEIVAGAMAGASAGMAGGGLIGSGVKGMVDTVFANKTVNENDTAGISLGGSINNATNKSVSNNSSDTITKGVSVSYDEINKSAVYVEEMIDKFIERFQKGLSYGMWKVSLYIQADDEIVLSELEHTLKSVYSGDDTHFEAIRFTRNLNDIDFNPLNFNSLYFDKDIVLHPIHQSFAGFNSIVNTQELAILSALPKNDIDGVSVSRISDFGLTQDSELDKYNCIKIGNISNKKKLTSQKFKLSFDAINSHVFVSGATGSGKSNTIKGILKKINGQKIPFLVIEPAKSEYKNLLNDIKGLQIFRPGAKNDIFRFNPFIFEYSKENLSTTLTKHIDMLKTTFISAFGMYGPMPYILEEAIYKIYEDRGWNLQNESNPYITDMLEADTNRRNLLFPTMDDLKQKVVEVVESAGYYQDIGSNIKAALKTRIGNLTLGVKGKIFNSRHCFDYSILFTKPTIIELSNIVNDDEKAFLMGLLLSKLYQYREENGSSDTLRHITVIEEAHRLLPNISTNTNQENANPRGKAVETFTNILAEIRSYGEGIIVADQIASKLHVDVIKNTNVKIIHRTMDLEDRNIVGKSVNLNEDQILDIAELKKGEAIVHNRDVHQAFLVKIDEFKEKPTTLEHINDFYKNFEDDNKKFKYEFLLEKHYYLEDKPNFKDLNLNTLKPKLMKFINSIIFDENNAIKNYEILKSEFPAYKTENEYIYSILYVFLNLNYISNYQYYRNIDAYMQAYEYFVYTILHISNKINKSIESIDIFKKAFMHKNIKSIFEDMKKYPTNEIDYTLLVLDNITTSSSLYKFWTDIAIDDALDKNLEIFSLKVFGVVNNQLKFALKSIKIIKETI
jgi:hypothetical protein